MHYISTYFVVIFYIFPELINDIREPLSEITAPLKITSKNGRKILGRCIDSRLWLASSEKSNLKISEKNTNRVKIKYKENTKKVKIKP